MEEHPQRATVNPFRGFIPESAEEANREGRPRVLSSDLHPFIVAHDEELYEFRQLSLLSESSFVSWCTDRDVPIAGVVARTDADLFWRKGWLRCDEIHVTKRSWRQRLNSEPVYLKDERRIGEAAAKIGRWLRYELQLHPFRFYTADQILKLMRWNLVRSNVLYAPGVLRYAKQYVKQFQRFRRSKIFLERIDEWNGVADLTIILEPLYWPIVTEWIRGGRARVDDESQEWQAYRDASLRLLESIPKGLVAGAHMDLRMQAALTDRNSEIYLLLRAMNWHHREQIKGRLGAAMWMRHMAEVIRHGYDELYEDRLVHEDEALGFWHKGARKWAYGSDYPLENIPEMVRRILPQRGLTSSPRSRFYVEGETEEALMRLALEGYIGYGIEVVNVAGRWNSWLRSELLNDLEAKRISLLMLDSDRKDFIRSVKALAREKLIVGMVFVNEPDLERGCFTDEELVQAIRNYEDAVGFQSGDPLNIEFLRGTNSGAELEERYQKLNRVRSLKGKDWGESLLKAIAKGATEENKLVHAISCGIRAITTNYEAQETRYRVDPETLKSVPTGKNLMGEDEKPAR